MLKAAEKVAAPVYRGVRRLKNRMLNRVDPPVIVLAYHRVARLPSDPHQLAVTPENFRAQMHYLRQNCRLLRFEADWSNRGGPAVAVTFDDGYADNLHAALPILEQSGVPATFFVSVGQLKGDREFWSDELESLVLHGECPVEFPLADRHYGGRWPAGELAERLALHARLHSAMLRVDARRREECLVQLRDWRHAKAKVRPAYRALTKQELRTLAASPQVTIGAHGVTHTPLANLPQAEQRREITASKAALEELLGREVEVFSYPFGGRKQVGDTARRICREAGFRRAVTTLPGQVHRWTDPWRLPRQLVRNWDVATFAAQLENFWVG